MRAVVIGLGGIGSNLIEPLARLLVYSKSKRAPKRLILVDGDRYEERNRERQRFTSAANKAEATKEWLASLFPKLTVEAKPHFADDSNIFVLIKEGDVVFLAVDNHATRKLVSDYLGTLENALLISGGNELYDGNVQIYLRREGKDLTPPLTWQHPEIEKPVDRNPAGMSCEELAQRPSSFQLIAVNFTAAALMLNAFTLWLQESPFRYGEVYFDIKTGNVRPVLLPT